MINDKIRGTFNSLCSSSKPEVIELFLNQQSFEYREFIKDGFLCACDNKNKDVINYLLENEHVYAEEVISHIMYTGNLDILKTLMKSIDLDDDHNGIAELSYEACACGHIHILEYFLKNPDLKEKTVISITEKFALWAAYQEDKPQMVDFLLYDLNIQTPTGYKKEIKNLAQVRIEEEDWTTQEADDKSLAFIMMIEKRDNIYQASAALTDELLKIISNKKKYL